MKFAKGIMLGTIISAGIMWIYTESCGKDSKKIVKKGKKFIKQMGFPH